MVHIGTSGWQYRHWLGPFYPARLPSSRMLATYAERFDTVEINTSFYGLPTVKTLTAWREATPPGFGFAFKASRYITHLTKLRDPAEPLARLLSRAEVLGTKLGPILFQLPPSWPCDPTRLADFLAALPAGHRYAMEFRHPSWHTNAVYDLLQRHRVAYCQYELAGWRTPEVITADFTYVRLHGPGGKYQGRYGDEGLRPWVDRLVDWDQRLQATYVYFDNDEAGYAPLDAVRLREVVRAHQAAERVA